MTHYQGHGNPYGQMDPYGNIPTPMEMSQEKLEDKANRWQALQSKVCPLGFESSLAAVWCYSFIYGCCGLKLTTLHLSSIHLNDTIALWREAQVWIRCT